MYEIVGEFSDGEIVPEISDTSDIFGLEAYRSGIGGLETAGREVFSDALHRFETYMARHADKYTFAQFKDADATVELPEVISERICGRSTVTADADGSGMITFTTGNTPSTRQAAGFRLYQRADGIVCVMPADINSDNVWTPQTIGYQEAITTAGNYLKTYFEVLATVKTSEALRKKLGDKANTLYGVRSALGSHTVTVMGREVNIPRSDRSAKKILRMIADEGKTGR